MCPKRSEVHSKPRNAVKSGVVAAFACSSVASHLRKLFAGLSGSAINQPAMSGTARQSSLNTSGTSSLSECSAEPRKSSPGGSAGRVVVAGRRARHAVGIAAVLVDRAAVVLELARTARGERDRAERDSGEERAHRRRRLPSDSPRSQFDRLSMLSTVLTDRRGFLRWTAGGAALLLAPRRARAAQPETALASTAPRATRVSARSAPRCARDSSRSFPRSRSTRVCRATRSRCRRGTQVARCSRW